MKPPCKNCPDRAQLVIEFGGCHNEHCPHGWVEWEKEKESLNAKKRADFSQVDAYIFSKVKKQR